MSKLYAKIKFKIKDYFFQRKLKKRMEEIKKKDPFIYD
jgi:hypothetical protein|tara:strand:- start:11257 stop:11370 length:114 start_codon:yes stop_codon:yes gene_type:complete